jgi:hypothetical protein
MSPRPLQLGALGALLLPGAADLAAQAVTAMRVRP